MVSEPLDPVKETLADLDRTGNVLGYRVIGLK